MEISSPLGPEEEAEPCGRPPLAVQDKFGGYDCKFVEPPTSAFQTECLICHLVLRDPYQFKCCGTSFCHSCFERLQDEHKPCPACRTENFEIFPNKGLKRSLNQLYVLCPHSEDGCEWRGELGELEHHSETVHPSKSFQHKGLQGRSFVVVICQHGILNAMPLSVKNLTSQTILQSDEA